MNFLNTLWKSFLAIFVLIGVIGCNGDDKGLLGGGGATEPPETRDVTIVKLMVSPKDNAIPVGVLLPLNANLLLSDGSIVDVTSSDNIIWSSSDESITKVNPDGTVEGMVVGDTTITAQYTEDNETLTDTARVMVTDAIATGLQVTPKVETLAAGYEKPFVATATFSDGTAYEVTTESYLNWDSSDIAMATVDTDGSAKGMGAGIVEVSAVANINGVGVRDTAELTITDAIATELRVSPEVASVSKGLTQAFKAEIVFSDGSTQDVTTDSALTWTSSDEAVATIDTSGLATGVTAAASPTTIKAHISDILTDTSDLMTTEAIIKALEISPDSNVTTVGQTLPFTVKAIFSDNTSQDVTNEPIVNWVTSDPNIATITTGQSSGNGVAKGVAEGSVEVSATTAVEGETIRDTALLEITGERLIYIDVDPSSIEVGVNKVAILNAKGTYTNGDTVDLTKEVNWTGQNTSLATVGNGVNNGGVVTGVALGNTTTVATMSDGYGNIIQSAPASIVVTSQVTELKLSTTFASVVSGEAEKITVTGVFEDGTERDVTDKVSWAIADEELVDISENGLVTKKALDSGDTVAFATMNDIQTEVLTLTVCDSLLDACVDTFDAFGNGTLYSSPVSLSLYTGLVPVTNMFDLPEEVTESEGYGPTEPGGVSSTSIVSGNLLHVYQWCEAMSDVRVSGRSNWRLLDVDEAVTFTKANPDIYQTRGWPTSLSRLHTSTLLDGGVYDPSVSYLQQDNQMVVMGLFQSDKGDSYFSPGRLLPNIYNHMAYLMCISTP